MKSADPAAPRLDNPLVDTITPQEIEFFHQEGYLIVRGLVAPKLLARLLEVAQEGLQREIEPVEYEADVHYPGSPESRESEGGRTVRRLKQAFTRDYCFTELITQPGILTRLMRMFGTDVVMPLAHHNCIMTKQPKYSSDTDWHQDIRYWAYEKPDLISVWVALGEENRQNGCLQLIPGTHRMEFRRDQLDDLLFLRTDLPENQQLIEQKIYAELQPGDVLFFHSRTYHAASRNFTQQSKFSAVFTFRSTDNAPRRGSRSAGYPELLLPHLD